MYDWEELYGSSEEEIYVGFAAARNMTIKVDEINLTFSDPATDPPTKNDQTKSSSQSIVYVKQLFRRCEPRAIL